MTRDEVVKALECCCNEYRGGITACTACPMNGPNGLWDTENYPSSCLQQVLENALVLLKQDSADLVDGIQAMREICWMHVCDDCPAYGKAKSCGGQCAFFPDHDGLSPQEVAEIIWAYQAKKRKEEKADG